MVLQRLMGSENSRRTGARSVPAFMLAGTVGAVLITAGCGGTSGDGELTVEERSVEQPSHGPIPNVHVRLVEGPNVDHVLCDGRVRGLAGDASLYSASLIITYPDASTTTRTGDVNLAQPMFEDTTDGEFRVELVESSLGSGEYTVKATLKHETTEDVGAHHCRTVIEEFGTGGSTTRVLHAEGQATSAATDIPDPFLTATSHRQSGSHLSCQARLNHADPATDYLVLVQTNTVAGPDTRIVDADATLPLIGVSTTNGGNVLVERGTASWSPLVPSLNVRFDFNGPVGRSSCAVTVQEATTGSTVLSETTEMSVATCTDLLDPHGGFESGIPSPFWTEASTQFGTPLCDGSCGTGGTGPRSGLYWFWGGGITGAEVGFVERTVIIPVGSASLSWWMAIPSCALSGLDVFQVFIDGAVVYSTNNFDAQCNTAGYQLKQISLDAYADGGPHTIRFQSSTNSLTVLTNFMVDDITLTSCE